MSTYVLSDSATMLRRDFRHLRRYPVMTISTVVTPAAMMLLFVYVFGGAIGAGLASGGSYVDYIVPGILMMTIGAGCAATAVGANGDMSEGIIARFRTMPIARASVLTGRVLGSMIRTLASVALVLGIGLLIGFRPTAGPVEWVAAIGFIVVFTFAWTWLAIALGISAKSPEGANASTLLLQFGPFLSSAFVPTETMPAGARWFAENQPFTPMIETLRGLLFGIPLGNNAVIASAWAVVIALTGYLWARAAYNKAPAK